MQHHRRADVWLCLALCESTHVFVDVPDMNACMTCEYCTDLLGHDAVLCSAQHRAVAEAGVETCMDYIFIAPCQWGQSGSWCVACNTSAAKT